MDRYDFNIKVEKLKELAKEKDYENAMKIADAIDWRRVQDSKLLQVVSEVYENNGEYGEAKEILLLAYERSGLGRRFLYKLVELAIKEGSLKEAESYSKEFEEIAHGDSRIYLLRYQILSAKGEDIHKRIEALQNFNARELDEKYMYELAKLYYEANMDEDCLRVCDNIMLMFGLGRYVDKAMKLKVEKLGVPLNAYQQGLVDHKEQYEDRLRVVEEEFSNQDMDIESIEREIEDRENTIDEIDFEAPSVEEAEQMRELDEEIARHIEEIEEPENVNIEEISANLPKAVSVEEVLEPLEDEDIKEDENLGRLESLENVQNTDASEASFVDSKEEKVEAISEDKSEGSKDFSDIEDDIKAIEKSLEYTGIDSIDEPIEDRIIYLVENDANLSIDKIVSDLKAENDSIKDRQLIKIRAQKLNDKDLEQVFPKLEGKALLVEEAGDLAKDKFELIREASILKDIKFIFVDNNLQLDKLKGKVEQDYAREKAIVQNTSIKEELEEEKARMAQEKYLSEELSIDDFATYASDYATEIDCSITGKSMLALYERIEFMQDEHIPLTRKNAEELITEAADKAEKPALLRSLKGVLSFERKYDKDGKLILKEEHFAI